MPQDPNGDEITLDQWEREQAKRFGVPLSIVRALTTQESGNRQTDSSGRTITGPETSRGRGRAKGRFQIMPGTARDLGIDADDPFENTYGGIKYLKEGYDEAAKSGVQSEGARWAASLTRYHGGSGAVRGALQRGGEIRGSDANMQTARYVQNIMDRSQRIERGEEPIAWTDQDEPPGPPPPPKERLYGVEPKAGRSPYVGDTGPLWEPSTGAKAKTRAAQAQAPPAAPAGPRPPPKIAGIALPLAAAGQKPAAQAQGRLAPGQVDPYQAYADQAAQAKAAREQTRGKLKAAPPPDVFGRKAAPAPGATPFETLFGPQTAALKEAYAAPAPPPKPKWVRPTGPASDPYGVVAKHYQQQQAEAAARIKARPQGPALKPPPPADVFDVRKLDPKRKTATEVTDGAAESFDVLFPKTDPTVKAAISREWTPGEVAYAERIKAEKARPGTIFIPPTVPGFGGVYSVPVGRGGQFVKNLETGGMQTAVQLVQGAENIGDLARYWSPKPGVSPELAEQRKRDKAAADAEFQIREKADPSFGGQVQRVLGQGLTQAAVYAPLAVLGGGPAAMAAAAGMTAAQQDWRNRPVEAVLETITSPLDIAFGGMATKAFKKPLIKLMAKPMLQEMAQYGIGITTAGVTEGVQEGIVGLYDIHKGTRTAGQVVRDSFAAALGAGPLGGMGAGKIDLSRSIPIRGGVGSPMLNPPTPPPPVVRGGMGSPLLNPPPPPPPIIRGGPGSPIMNPPGPDPYLSKLNNLDLMNQVELAGGRTIPPEDAAALKAEARRRGPEFLDFMKEVRRQRGDPDVPLGPSPTQTPAELAEGQSRMKSAEEVQTWKGRNEALSNQTRTRLRTLGSKGSVAVDADGLATMQSEAPELFGADGITVKKQGNKFVVSANKIGDANLEHWKAGRDLTAAGEVAPAAEPTVTPEVTPAPTAPAPTVEPTPAPEAKAPVLPTPKVDQGRINELSDKAQDLETRISNLQDDIQTQADVDELNEMDRQLTATTAEIRALREGKAPEVVTPKVPKSEIDLAAETGAKPEKEPGLTPTTPAGPTVVKSLPTHEEADKIEVGKPLVIEGLRESDGRMYTKGSGVGTRSDIYARREVQPDGTYKVTVHKIPSNVPKQQFQAELGRAQKPTGKPAPRAAKSLEPHAQDEERMQALTPGESMTVPMDESARRALKRKYKTENNPDADFTVVKAKDSESAVITRIDKEAVKAAAEEKAARVARGETEPTPTPTSKPTRVAPEQVAALKNVGDTHTAVTTKPELNSLIEQYKDDPTIKVRGEILGPNKWNVTIRKVDPNAAPEPKPKREVKPGYEDPDAFDRPDAGWGMIASKAFNDTTSPDGKSVGAFFADPSVQSALGLEPGRATNLQDVKKALAAKIGKRSMTEVSPAEYRNWMRDQGWGPDSDPWRKFESASKAAGFDLPSKVEVAPKTEVKPETKPEVKLSAVAQDVRNELTPHSRAATKNILKKYYDAAAADPEHSGLKDAVGIADQIVEIDEELSGLTERLEQGDAEATRRASQLLEDKSNLQEDILDYSRAASVALINAERAKNAKVQAVADTETLESGVDERARLIGEAAQAQKDIREATDRRKELGPAIANQQASEARTAAFQEDQQLKAKIARLETEKRKAEARAKVLDQQIQAAEGRKAPEPTPAPSLKANPLNVREVLDLAQDTVTAADAVEVLGDKTWNPETRPILAPADAKNLINQMEAEGLIRLKDGRYSITEKGKNWGKGAEGVQQGETVSGGKKAKKGAKEPKVSAPKKGATGDTGTQVETGEEAAGGAAPTGSKEVPGVKRPVPGAMGEHLKQMSKAPKPSSPEAAQKQLGKLEEVSHSMEQIAGHKDLDVTPQQFDSAVSEVVREMGKKGVHISTLHEQLKAADPPQGSKWKGWADSALGTEPFISRAKKSKHKRQAEKREAIATEAGEKAFPLMNWESGGTESQKGWQVIPELWENNNIRALQVSPKMMAALDVIDNYHGTTAGLVLHANVWGQPKHTQFVAMPANVLKFITDVKSFFPELGNHMQTVLNRGEALMVLVTDPHDLEATRHLWENVLPHEAVHYGLFNGTGHPSPDGGKWFMNQPESHRMRLEFAKYLGVASTSIDNATMEAEAVAYMAVGDGERAFGLNDDQIEDYLTRYYEHLANRYGPDVFDNIAFQNPNVKGWMSAASEKAKQAGVRPASERSSSTVAGEPGFIVRSKKGVPKAGYEGHQERRAELVTEPKDNGWPRQVKYKDQDGKTRTMQPVSPVLAVIEDEVLNASGAGGFIVRAFKPIPVPEHLRQLPPGMQQPKPRAGAKGTAKPAAATTPSPAPAPAPGPAPTTPLKTTGRRGYAGTGAPPAPPPGPPPGPPGLTSPGLPGQRPPRHGRGGGGMAGRRAQPIAPVSYANEVGEIVNLTQIFNHLVSFPFWGRNVASGVQNRIMRRFEDAVQSGVDRMISSTKGASRAHYLATREERKEAKSRAKVEARKTFKNRHVGAAARSHFAGTPQQPVRLMQIVKQYPALKSVFEPMETALMYINTVPDDVGKLYHGLLTAKTTMRVIADHIAANPAAITPQEAKRLGKWMQREIDLAEAYWSYRQRNWVSRTLGGAKTLANLATTAPQAIFGKSKSGTLMQRAKNAKIGLGDFVSGLKYHQIPGAVISHSLERIPVLGAVPLVRAIGDWKKAQASGSFAKEAQARVRMERVIAKQAAGGAMAGIGAIAYALGMIEEDFDDNPAVAQTQKETGHRPYALNLSKLYRYLTGLGSIPSFIANEDHKSKDGDFLLDIQLIQPLGVEMAIGSAFTHAMSEKFSTDKEAKEKLSWGKWTEKSLLRTGSVFAAAADTALEQLVGQRYFTDLFNAISYAPEKDLPSIGWRFLSTALETGPSQVVPYTGQLAQVETLFSPYVQESRSERVSGQKPETWLQEVKHTALTGAPVFGTHQWSKLPYLSKNVSTITGKKLPTALSAWGQERESIPGTAKLPFGARLINTLSPVRYTRVQEQPIQKEAARIGVAPSNVGYREGETAEERYQRNLVRGKLLFEQGNLLVKDPGWKDIPLEHKKKIMKMFYRRMGKVASDMVGRPESQKEAAEEDLEAK